MANDDGVYHCINGERVASSQFFGQLVSVCGYFVSQTDCEHFTFLCCDGVPTVILFDSSIHAIQLGEAHKVEIVGQLLGVDDVPPFTTGFVQCVLRPDFDFMTNNEMILLMHIQSVSVEGEYQYA